MSISNNNNQNNDQLSPLRDVLIEEEALEKLECGEVRYPQMRSMRLSQPNDDIAARLFLALPNIISHDMDQMSPLLPPVGWRPKERVRCITCDKNHFSYHLLCLSDYRKKALTLCHIMA